MGNNCYTKCPLQYVGLRVADQIFISFFERVISITNIINKTETFLKMQTKKGNRRQNVKYDFIIF